MNFNWLIAFVMLFISSSAFSQQILNDFSLSERITSADQDFFDGTTAKIWSSHLFQNNISDGPKKQLSTPQDHRFNHLFNYGVIDAFIGGLYKGTLPVEELKQKGDFGLGAPDMLDGELTMLNGIAYQTTSVGKTVVLENEHHTAFASVTFFKADSTFYITESSKKEEVYKWLEDVLHNKNAMYAIKISGTFDSIRTRAFPSIEAEPFPPLSTILDKQQFFEYSQTKGSLVGFYLPEFLNGINASGFHFHFLSDDKSEGGHLLDFLGSPLKVEIAILKSMELQLPNDKAFKDFQFQIKENEALKKVEQGQ